MANSTIAGVPAVPYSPSDPDFSRTLANTMCHGAYTLLIGTADAIPYPGIVLINSQGVNAMTLAAPKAGIQPMGDDGKTIFVVSNSNQAHTITTPASTIIANRHICTFGAQQGNNITLTAMAGMWVVNGTPVGVTIT